jgi:hypothetical protein
MQAEAEKYAQVEAAEMKTAMLEKLKQSIMAEVKAAQASLPPVAPAEEESPKPQETIAPAPPAAEVREEQPADSDDQESP